jgi:hypothetical protein
LAFGFGPFGLLAPFWLVFHLPPLFSFSASIPLKGSIFPVVFGRLDAQGGSGAAGRNGTGFQAVVCQL